MLSTFACHLWMNLRRPSIISANIIRIQRESALYNQELNLKEVF